MKGILSIGLARSQMTRVILLTVGVACCSCHSQDAKLSDEFRHAVAGIRVPPPGGPITNWRSQWDRVEQLAMKMSKANCIDPALVRELLTQNDDIQYEAGARLLSYLSTSAQAPLIQGLLQNQMGTERTTTLLWMLIRRPAPAQIPLFRQHLYDKDAIVCGLATYGISAAAKPADAIPLLEESARKGQRMRVFVGPEGEVEARSTAVYYLALYGHETEGILVGLLHEKVSPGVIRDILREFLSSDNSAGLEYCLDLLTKPVSDDGVWITAADTIFRFGNGAAKKALINSALSISAIRQWYLARFAKAAGDDYAFDLCVLAVKDEGLASNISILWKNDPQFIERLMDSRFNPEGYGFRGWGFEGFRGWYRAHSQDEVSPNTDTVPTQWVLPQEKPSTETTPPK